MSANFQEHLKILRAAVAGDLPLEIHRDCAEYSYIALRELHDAGMMAGTRVDFVDKTPPKIMRPIITLVGREYLAKLEQQVVPNHAREPAGSPSDEKKQWFEKPIGKVGLALVSGLLVALAAWILKTYFGLALGS